MKELLWSLWLCRTDVPTTFASRSARSSCLGRSDDRTATARRSWGFFVRFFIRFFYGSCRILLAFLQVYAGLSGQGFLALGPRRVPSSLGLWAWGSTEGWTFLRACEVMFKGQRPYNHDELPGYLPNKKMQE